MVIELPLRGWDAAVKDLTQSRDELKKRAQALDAAVVSIDAALTVNKPSDPSQWEAAEVTQHLTEMKEYIVQQRDHFLVQVNTIEQVLRNIKNTQKP